MYVADPLILIIADLICVNNLTVIIVNYTFNYSLQVEVRLEVEFRVRKKLMEEKMDAVMFFVFWIGAATIHTLIELRIEAVASRRVAKALALTGRSKQKYESDRC